MPEQLGPYTVVGEVGRGATGVVYLGHDPELDRPVALKVLSPTVVDQPGFRERFAEEARLMAAIDDPNCVRVYDFDGGERPYIVSEYIAGATVREVVASAGSLSAEQALGILDGALAGLAAVHARSLVHRDIKPDNIFCDVEGRSRLGDFGLAVATGTVAPAMSAGSAHYMSPELVGGLPVDARSDIYACGATLFELLAGQPPYPGADPVAVMRRQQKAAVPDPRKVNKTVAAPVAALARRAMAKSPDDRPQSVAEFRVELEDSARRAYGAGWRTAASISAATGAAVAAGTAATTALAAGGMAAAGTTATVGTATVSAATTAAATPAATSGATIASVPTGSAATGGGITAVTGSVARKGLGTGQKVAAGVAAVVLIAVVAAGAAALTGKPAAKSTTSGAGSGSGAGGGATAVTELPQDVTFTGQVSGHPATALAYCNHDGTHGYHVHLTFKGLPGAPVNLYLIGPSSAGTGPFKALEPLGNGTSVDTISVRSNGNDLIADISGGAVVTWTLAADGLSGTVNANLVDSANPQASGSKGQVKGSWRCVNGTLAQAEPRE